MKKSRRFSGLCVFGLGVAMLALGTGCLPENFWVNKMGEILNLAILNVVTPQLDNLLGTM